MDFDETARDNTRAILEALEKAGGDMDRFLRDPEVRVPIFPCPLPPEKNPVLTTDLDGLVVELSSLTCVSAAMHFLFLDHNRVQPHWHMLKKHLRTQEYSSEELKLWHVVHGVRLGYVDGGYSLQLSFVPDKPGPCSSQPLDKTRMSHYTTRALQSVVTILKQRMAGLDASDLSRPTVQKNVLTDLTKVAICHQDQKWLLAQLDSAIQEATIYPRGLRFMVTLVRLGQKDPMTVELYKVVDPLHHVVALSVHVACNIRSSDGHVDLMWSRRLVNSVCGRTGYVYTNQSVTEAANYASNTDHKSVDVGPAVWGLFRDVRGGYGVEGLLNFVQLYCDGPHRHQTPYYKHPVSGILATNGVLHKNTNRAMEQRAQKYLSHFKDLGMKGAAVLTARVEGLLLYCGRDVPRTLYSECLIDTNKVAELVAKRPALLPFLSTENEDVRGFRKELVPLELALEEYHHGQPRTPAHGHFSVSLETSSTNARSLTRTRGILGLAPHTSAGIGLSPPSLTIWTSNEVQQKHAAQLFTLAGSLSANEAVIGRHMIRALLKYVSYGVDEDDTVEALSRPLPLTKARPKDSVEYPALVFRRAIEMVREAGRDPALALLEGLRSFQMKFFPLLRFRDFKGGKRLQWNQKDFVEVREQGAPVSVATRAESLTEKVLQELMARELTGQGHLEIYQSHGMPWMSVLLTRMPREVTYMSMSPAWPS
ncbi:hypothetical protein WMY93_034198 [Mugilogobius chulae]|uniref:Uncharacterized protein n=1 Tax=Mugilogobius chulae TaxID=88201 RepID=A0AAW0MKC4_9GOBI